MASDERRKPATRSPAAPKVHVPKAPQIAKPRSSAQPRGLAGGRSGSSPSIIPITEKDDGKPRILVVDDDTAIRNLLERIAVRAGFDVETARDGGEAIHKIGAARKPGFTLILLDLMMPNISGFEVIEHLKEHHPDSLARVVVVTAAPKVSDERIRRERIRDVIQKPFDLNEITTYLRESAASA